MLATILLTWIGHLGLTVCRPVAGKAMVLGNQIGNRDVGELLNAEVEVGECVGVVMVNKSRLNRRGTGDYK